jgi:hypothetical protein
MESSKENLLIRLERQQARKKKKIFKIPTTRLSISEKKREVKKSVIPSLKSVSELHIKEDNVRKFLSEVNNLKSEDFELPTEIDNFELVKYDNKIINEGFELYKSVYIKDSARDIGIQNFNRAQVTEEIVKEWENSNMKTKLIWVMKGFANLKTSPWDMKYFVEKLDTNIKSEQMLRKFLDDYLKSNQNYKYFIEHWQVTDPTLTKVEELEQKTKYPQVELLGTTVEQIPRHYRLPLTKEEEEQIKENKERLAGLENAYENLQEKINTRTEELSEMSHKDLVNIAIPILGQKTNEELIQYLIDIQYMSIIREKYNNIFGSDWEEYSRRLKLYKKVEQEKGKNEAKKIFGDITSPDLPTEKILEYDSFTKELDTEQKEKTIELKNLPRNELVSIATEQKTSPELVKIIIRAEFGRKKEKLKDKMALLSIEIHNLGLGKIVIKKEKVKGLTFKESKFKQALEVYIRKKELENWSYDKLMIHSSNIKAYTTNPLQDLIERYGGGEEGKQESQEIKQKDVKKIIDNILRTEFPNSDPDTKLPKIDRIQMNNVLRTLSEKQLYILANINGISRPEKRGKGQIIDMILSIEFRKSIKTKQLIPSEYSSEWSYKKREKELNAMSPKEIKQIAYMMDINIYQGAKINNIIKQILNIEEQQSKLISKEDNEKEKLIKKISQLTGKSPSMYSLWSLEELNERFNVLGHQNKEYWVELERERLIKKLSMFVDINSEKYSKVNTWKLKKLRKTLQKLAGSDWDNDQPLIENYSFVKCMQEHNRFKWIDGKVTGVWLSSPTGKTPKSTYIHKDIWIKEDGHKWYQANKKFFVLQCNMYKNKRNQKGDVLTCFTQEGKPVQFKVGYTVIGYTYGKHKYNVRTHMVESEDGKKVRRTFIIQDEVMFRKEKQEIRRNNQSRYDAINDILNDLVTENSIEKVTKLISNSLLKISPMKKDYGIITFQNGIKYIDPNTPYMQILVSTLESGPEQTNRELFTKTANLLVYLDLPQAKMFRKNIEMEYYLPDILTSLSPKEKFPEAFENPELTERGINQITTKINNEIYKIVNSIAEQIYNEQYPTQRSPTISRSYYDYNKYFKTNKRLSACANKDRVKNVDPEKIVYYKEDNKIYCFTIDELYEQFIDGDITNPETGKDFNLKFVQRFDQLYNKHLSSDGFITNYFQEKYGFDIDELVEEKENQDTIKRYSPQIASDLWDIIGKDIEELEDELSNEKPGDGDEIDEKREEERREIEVKEGIRDSVEIDENDTCIYCQKHLSDDSIKTIIKHDDESRIIKFCSFKCFENKNDWKKFKKKKKKEKEKEKKKKEKEKEKKKKEKEKEEKKKEREEKKKKKEEPKDKPPKLSKEEFERRKELISQQIKEGIIQFDRMALPLMKKSELIELAKEKNIKLPKNLSKEFTAKYIFEQLHPKARSGIMDKDEASEKIKKVETRLDK